MMFLINNSKECYSISLDSTLRDVNTGKPTKIIMLKNNAGEGMQLNEEDIFIMIDDYFKKYF